MENSPVTIFDYKNNPVFSDYGELIEKSHKYFSNFGLTVNESKIYIFLIVYGKKIASDIIKTLKISRGEVTMF